MMFTKTVRYDGATLTVKPITFLWTYKSKENIGEKVVHGSRLNTSETFMFQ